MGQYKDDNLIVKLSFEFALEIIKYSEVLEERRKYNMSNQMWRSGTSVGTMVNEVLNAGSKVDFIHKMKIAGKESDETEYWLNLCKLSELYPKCDSLLENGVVINKIINKIFSSSKQ